MEKKSRFDEELENLGITLTDRQKDQFDRYYEMLVEWNSVMNLTGITDYDEVNLKHFTDSLTLVRNVDKFATALEVQMSNFSLYSSFFA